MLVVINIYIYNHLCRYVFASASCLYDHTLCTMTYRRRAQLWDEKFFLQSISYNFSTFSYSINKHEWVYCRISNWRTTSAQRYKPTFRYPDFPWRPRQVRDKSGRGSFGEVGLMEFGLSPVGLECQTVNGTRGRAARTRWHFTFTAGGSIMLLYAIS